MFVHSLRSLLLLRQVVLLRRAFSVTAMGNKQMIIREAGSELFKINEAQALKGRSTAMVVDKRHAVNGNIVVPPFPERMEMAMFGMGCFWGAEKLFWSMEHVYSTQVGYAMGYTENPMYQEVCSEKTGHAEIVRVIFDPEEVSYLKLLSRFWENHDPTMGMSQGNDVGTRYRSGIYYYTPEQEELAKQSKDIFAAQLKARQFKREITTELLPASEFYYAEDYHQQYLHKNEGGYCGSGGTGVPCSLQFLKMAMSEPQNQLSKDQTPENQPSGHQPPKSESSENKA